MAVLCEAISLIIRADSLIAVFGSLESFKRIVRNATLAADNELVRIGFMATEDVRAFVKRLEARGLHYVVDGTAQDMVVIDQMRGPAARCAWVEFGHVSIQGGRVAAAQLAGSDSHQLFTPEGWQFEGSLSQTYGFVPTGAEDKSMRFLYSEEGVDVYLNLVTGKKVYVGRTSES